MKPINELAAILDRLESSGHACAAHPEAEAFARRHGTEELLAMEDELRRQGMPDERMRLMCPSHAAAETGERAALRASLPEGHVVATLMDEHTRILAVLARLEKLAQSGGPDQEAAVGMRALARTLIGAEPHHQREERVVFPALRERGIFGPPRVMEVEHVEIRALKHRVEELAERLLAGEVGAWAKLRETAVQLVQMLREHIEKEDHVLYPLVLRAIADPLQWAEMKRRCDEIGYCCTHSGISGSGGVACG